MWLLDKMLRKLIRTGQLTITDYDGKVYRYGDGTGEDIRIRLTDRKASRHIARYPQVGAGEAFICAGLESMSRSEAKARADSSFATACREICHGSSGNSLVLGIWLATACRYIHSHIFSPRATSFYLCPIKIQIYKQCQQDILD